MAIQVLMPALSPTMTEGTLAKWLKAEGDAVQSGDVIAEIETDKATMEIEAADEGILARILVEDGTEGVKVNQVIGLIIEEGEDESALDGLVETPKEPEPAPQTPPETPPATGRTSEPALETAPQPAPQPAMENNGRRFASPLARRMAEDKGLDLGAIRGTGPNGRIVKRDVEAAADPVVMDEPSPATHTVHETSFKEIPNSTIRKVIAERLTEAKRDIPHFYLSADLEMDALLELRKELNAKAPEGEGAYRISVTDFIIRACALALKQVPLANASWNGDAIRIHDNADISVAVATPRGLITPVVRNAGALGLGEISREIKDLAARAQEGRLAPEEYQGGTFTVSNLGMYGVKEFAAIINPPQSCIMAVGAAEPRPVVRDGELAVATVMTVTLSVDHRSVDGVVGAEFLAAFKRLVEEPLTMLL